MGRGGRRRVEGGYRVLLLALADLELSMQTRLASNSKSCLALCPLPYDLEPFDPPICTTKHYNPQPVQGGLSSF